MSEIMPDEPTVEPFDLAELAAIELSAPPLTGIGTSPAPGTGPGLNYYKYFTEVEEEFVKRRGSHLWLSPLDWALIETWRDSGIPLHIVLRGINQSFDAYDKRPRKTRKVNSLFYCVQEVESCYADYQESQIGAPAESATAGATDKTASVPSVEPPEEFSRQNILDFLLTRHEELKRARTVAASTTNTRLQEILERALSRLVEIVQEVEQAGRLNSEGLERDLTSIEDLILETLHQSVPPEEREAVVEEGKAQLKAYKKKMPKEIYQQTLANYTAKRLRELHSIPRLSLFYLFER